MFKFAENFTLMSSIDEKALLGLVEAGLAAIDYPEATPSLYAPVEYTLAEGGKRLRPLLTLATACALGARPETALHQALAVEMFHNFTLIHDDVMDRSPRRRGRPTVFKKWGPVQAILSGDALLTLASREAARGAGDRLRAVMELFDTTALEVYEGQQLDMEFEARKRVGVNDYLRMIRLKTSVLLGCACGMGALMAGHADDAMQPMYDYGVALGLAFQLRDDWLDVWGDPLTFGKPIGGDIVNRKKTWLFLTASRRAPQRMELALQAKSRAALVARVRGVYEELGLDSESDALIKDYCEQAVGCLDRAPLGHGGREWFAALARRMCLREK